MRSPAERGRVSAERAVRGAALALVVFALWRVLQPAAASSAVFVESAALERDLPRLIASSVPAVHVSFSSTPSPSIRDALAALRHSGVTVTWSGGTGGTQFAPLAMGAERMPDPSASVRIVTTSNGLVELHDALSVIDTVQAAHGSTVIAGAPSGEVRAIGGASRASASVARASSQRPVLVLGRATWESKFTIAALEEAGWSVAARLSVAPGADVTQGAVLSLDTAHYSAVVALDSSMGSAAPQLARYVRSGGGLVVVGEAASASAVRDLAPAKRAGRRTAAIMTFDARHPLRSLAFTPLVAMRADAVPLDTHDGVAMVVARRVGAGRVAQVGYEALWRWRMQGGEAGPADHRAWWSRLVASVVPVPMGLSDAIDEGAPVARLFDALGAPTPAPPRRAPGEQLPIWLLPAICALLLAEWGSRRYRGAP
jgi:hypothetical protein